MHYVATVRPKFERTFVVHKFDTSKYDPSTSSPVEVKLSENEFKIVGFYSGVNIVASNSLILETSGMSNLGINLMQGRYSSILATDTGHASISKLSKLILNSSGITYNCKNSALATVRANSDFFAKLSTLFLILSIVFCLFSMVLFGNYISTSIKNKYSEIGILRALGARGVDILKMFIIESVALALINTVCAIAITALGCVFVNMFLSNALSMAIPLASFGIRQVLVLLGVSVAVGVVSATIPIMKVSKQKPVEIIRKVA